MIHQSRTMRALTESSKGESNRDRIEFHLMQAGQLRNVDSGLSTRMRGGERWCLPRTLGDRGYKEV